MPFKVIDPMLDVMRTRKLIAHVRPAPFNDYYYSLTELGQDRAQAQLRQCSYVGPAPVPLSDYVLSVEAQSAGLDPVTQDQLRQALSGISYQQDLLDCLGPAINSNSGLFLFGEPGNGKTTIARCLTQCLGQEIWIPHAILDDGNLVKLQDDVFHHPAPVPETHAKILKAQEWDRRWLRIQRPTVMVGGELIMDNLEVRHDPRSNICEAPLQMKSNCGCLLIDDFGRQQIEPAALLNRWIVPLESRYDYLTLPTGKKIQVPFEQLVIFSTNLEPEDLVDEAFLRRIPYKIPATDPTEEEFHFLFQMYCKKFSCEYRRDVVNYLLETHYRACGRAMRRCHPRDLLLQIRNYCRYNELPMELLIEYFDAVVETYFAMVLKTSSN
ncbi:MAG: AAA family ATPase [Planctomycetales bacterium]|nr:AAA family ATPase [Planctomycetales bacterium]